MKVFDLDIGPLFLDGGSIFGVVPKTKWEKLIIPNENNQIELGLNPVLIDNGNQKILVDCGTNNSIELLIAKLNLLNISCEEITDVIFTHLHFDHCGGALKVKDNRFEPVFENALYHCSDIELEKALNTDERTQHFYNSDIVSFLKRENLLTTFKPDSYFSDGIYLKDTKGHTEGHVAVIVFSNIQHIIAGDCIPTEFHLKVNYMTAYDSNLKENLKSKKSLLSTYSNRKTKIHFYHSRKILSGYLTKEEKRYKLIL